MPSSAQILQPPKSRCIAKTKAGLRIVFSRVISAFIPSITPLRWQAFIRKSGIVSALLFSSSQRRRDVLFDYGFELRVPPGNRAQLPKANFAILPI